MLKALRGIKRILDLIVDWLNKGNSCKNCYYLRKPHRHIRGWSKHAVMMCGKNTINFEHYHVDKCHTFIDTREAPCPKCGTQNLYNSDNAHYDEELAQLITEKQCYNCDTVYFIQIPTS